MSIDLFVIREAPEITWAEVTRAFAAIVATHEAVCFFSRADDGESESAYFWNVRRASVSRAVPSAEDIEEDDPPALARPLLVVSSNSRLWPWIDWVAHELAKRLGAQVFDPQEAGMAGPGPAYDFPGLAALNDRDMRENKGTILATYTAYLASTPRVYSTLATVVEAFRAAARDALGLHDKLDITPEQVSWSHTYRGEGNASIEVSASVSEGLWVSIRGPRDLPQPGALAAAIATAIGIRLRRVDEWVAESRYTKI